MRGLGTAGEHGVTRVEGKRGREATEVTAPLGGLLSAQTPANDFLFLHRQGIGFSMNPGVRDLSHMHVA